MQCGGHKAWTGFSVSETEKVKRRLFLLCEIWVWKDKLLSNMTHSFLFNISIFSSSFESSTYFLIQLLIASLYNEAKWSSLINSKFNVFSCLQVYSLFEAERIAARAFRRRQQKWWNCPEVPVQKWKWEETFFFFGMKTEICACNIHV